MEQVIIIIFLILGGFFIVKGVYSKAFFFLSFPAIVLLTLGLTKIHQGSDSVFFSYSRMYLGLPIIIAIAVSFIKKIHPKFFYFLLVVPIGLFVYKISVLDNKIEYYTGNRNHIISIDHTQDVLSKCDNLYKLSEKHAVDLILVINNNSYDFVNYGCPACIEKFPKTLRPEYERRTWRLLEDEKKAYNNILVLDDKNELDLEFDNILKVERFKYLIQNNQVKTMELLKSLNIRVREF